MLPQLKIYKEKSRMGIIERLIDDNTVLCRGKSIFKF